MVATQVPMSRWVDKNVVVHMHNGILLGYKKGWDLTICYSMDGPRGYYAEWNKSVRETNTIWFHLYVESKEQNKQNWNRLKDTENRPMVARKEDWVKKAKGLRSTNW